MPAPVPAPAVAVPVSPAEVGEAVVGWGSTRGDSALNSGSGDSCNCAPPKQTRSPKPENRAEQNERAIGETG